MGHAQVIEKLGSPGAISGIALQEYERWDNAELERHIRQICIDLDPLRRTTPIDLDPQRADEVSLLRTVDCRTTARMPRRQRPHRHMGTHHYNVAGTLLDPANCKDRVDKCHVFHNSAS